MTKRDYYDVMGVSKSAAKGEIKKAYRKIAKKYHPDKNKGDKGAEAKFKEATEAYEVLFDTERRAQYDRFGHNGVGKGAPGDRADGTGFGDSFSGFGDIFGDLFGDYLGRGNHRQPRFDEWSADSYYTLNITLEQAAAGDSLTIEIPLAEICGTCNGRGAKSTDDMDVCPRCGGSGQQAVRQGSFNVASTCHRCQGSGRLVKIPCPDCNGSGQIQAVKKIKVKVPSGVFNGSKIKLAGKGYPGLNGRPSGDLFLEIKVLEHSVFKRNGDDLSCQVPISITKAALGGKVEVPTLTGKAALKIPPESGSGQVFRLKGQGISHLKGAGKGDLYVKVKIEIPVNLNERQKELLWEFEEVSGENS